MPSIYKDLNGIVWFRSLKPSDIHRSPEIFPKFNGFRCSASSWLTGPRYFLASFPFAENRLPLAKLILGLRLYPLAPIKMMFYTRKLAAFTIFLLFVWEIWSVFYNLIFHGLMSEHILPAGNKSLFRLAKGLLRFFAWNTVDLGLVVPPSIGQGLQADPINMFWKWCSEYPPNQRGGQKMQRAPEISKLANIIPVSLGYIMYILYDHMIYIISYLWG